MRRSGRRYFGIGWDGVAAQSFKYFQLEGFLEWTMNSQADIKMIFRERKCKYCPNKWVHHRAWDGVSYPYSRVHKTLNGDVPAASVSKRKVLGSDSPSCVRTLYSRKCETKLFNNFQFVMMKISHRNIITTTNTQTIVFVCWQSVTKTTGACR